MWQVWRARAHLPDECLLLPYVLSGAVMGALTMEQAMTGQHFHFDMDGCRLECAVTYGKTGKAQPRASIFEWRRNGATKTWKTRPNEYRIPVKYGIRDYRYITQDDHVHLAKDCPALREVNEYWDARRAQS